MVEIPDTASTVGWLDDTAVETRVQMLMSDSHLKRVFDSLVSDTQHPAAAAIPYDILQRNLNAYKELHSRVIAVTYVDSDPVLAAFVANKSATIYLNTLAERWRSERGDIKALDAQIPIVRAHAQKAEAAVQAYRSASGVTGSKVADVAGTVQPANSELRQAEVQLRDLKQEAAATALLYESLLKRQRDLVSQEVPAPEVRIASLATPPNLPSSFNPLLFIPPAVVIALIMGAFAAITLERLDISIRSQEDVTNALGIPCVGLVPNYECAPESRWHSLKTVFERGTAGVLASMLQPKRSERNEHQRVLSPYLSFLENPFSPYSEAIRSTVISTLEQTQRKRHPQIILITSSVQGEGKTTLAVSFAAYAAQLGRKVLLTDFNFRKPGILEQLAGRDETGILELLEGRPAADLIKHHPKLRIDYLPLPRHWVDPLPLLHCSNRSEVLQQLGKGYDCLVIDSAPLLGTTETRLLSMIADKIVLAVRWGSTRQDIAQHAVRQLQAPGRARNKDDAVAVITRVDLKLHSRYRFGDVSEVIERFPYPNAQAHHA